MITEIINPMDIAKSIYEPIFNFCPLNENTCEKHLNTFILEYSVFFLKKSSGVSIGITS